MTHHTTKSKVLIYHPRIWGVINKSETKVKSIHFNTEQVLIHNQTLVCIVNHFSKSCGVSSNFLCDVWYPEEFLMVRDIANKYFNEIECYLDEKDTQTILNLIQMNDLERDSRRYLTKLDMFYDNIVRAFKLNKYINRSVYFNERENTVKLF